MMENSTFGYMQDLLSRLAATGVSYQRIAGYSATIAAHVAMLLLLTIAGQPKFVENGPEETVVQVTFLPHVGEVFRPTTPAQPPAKKRPKKVAKNLPKKVDPPPTQVIEEATEQAAVEQVMESKNLEAVLASEDEMSELDVPPPDYPPSEILSYRTAHQPVYPIEARAAGESGWVTLRVLVDAEGWPITFVLVNTTATDRLVVAAIDAIKKWKFNPATMRDGTKVPAWVEVPIGFFNSRNRDGSQTAALATPASNTPHN